VLGVCLRGLYDLVKFPVAVYGGQKFEHVGNMTSPQFYLMGIVLLLGIRTFRPQVLGKAFWFCPPLIVTGLLLHQKRGVWLASMVTIGLWTVWMRYWKILITMAVLAGLSLFLPFVQVRLNRLIEVIQPTHGGRMVLWTQVAPRLLPEYPWGMGYNGSTYEDFREALPKDIHMEEGLRHLHNNFLQIRLELGWHGVMFWTLWMGSVLWIGFARYPKQNAALRYTVAFAFLGLMLNGLVEYNFGDSEVLKAYLVLFGLLDVFRMKVESQKTPKAQKGAVA
jgi:O-antigen ligase